MSKFYQIRNLSPFFDGLFVEGDEQTLLFEGLNITRLIDRSITIGDRDINYSFPLNSLFISTKYLHLVDDPRKREYSTTNPWGQFVETFEKSHDVVTIVVTKYEKALQVSVIDTTIKKNIWSDYFYKDIDELYEFIKNYDPQLYHESLVFDLESLKEKYRK